MTVSRREALHSYWFDRFQVFDEDLAAYACRDWLHRGERLVLKRDLAGLEAPERASTLFRKGFVRPCCGRQCEHAEFWPVSKC